MQQKLQWIDGVRTAYEKSPQLRIKNYQMVLVITLLGCCNTKTFYTL